MEDNALSSVVLGIIAVLLVFSVVLIPLAILIFYFAYGKGRYETLQKEQHDAREEARARLISKGIVKEDKWV